jgi:hypothetical protein
MLEDEEYKGTRIFFEIEDLRGAQELRRRIGNKTRIKKKNWKQDKN